MVSLIIAIQDMEFFWWGGEDFEAVVWGFKVVPSRSYESTSYLLVQTLFL